MALREQQRQEREELRAAEMLAMTKPPYRSAQQKKAIAAGRLFTQKAARRTQLEAAAGPSRRGGADGQHRLGVDLTARLPTSYSRRRACDGRDL